MESQDRIKKRLIKNIEILISHLEKNCSDILNVKNASTILLKERINVKKVSELFNDLIFNYYLEVSLYKDRNKVKYARIFNKIKADFQLLNNKKEVIDKIAYLYVLLMLFNMKNYTTVPYTISSEKISDAYNRMGNNLYYRGVSNINFDLLPSMYRNINKNPVIIIDDNFIFNKYKERKLNKKYFDIFGKKYNEDIYEFESYMQHALEYSPLIDFTKSVDIAKSFATNYYDNYNQYNINKAGVYVLEDTNAKNNRNIKHKIIIYNKKLDINEKFKNKKLYYCSFKDFEIVYFLYKKAVNDRMKYQQGVFVDIKKAVYLNGYLMKPLKRMGTTQNDTLYKQLLTLWIIEKKDKLKLYKTTKEKNKYQNLMNPYKYFSEL